MSRKGVRRWLWQHLEECIQITWVELIRDAMVDLSLSREEIYLEDVQLVLKSFLER